jgi:hypothetical protein
MVYFKGVKHINVFLTLVFRASAARGRCSVGVEKMPDRCAPGGSRFARLYFDKVKSIRSGCATPF